MRDDLWRWLLGAWLLVMLAAVVARDWRRAHPEVVPMVWGETQFHTDTTGEADSVSFSLVGVPDTTRFIRLYDPR